MTNLLSRLEGPFNIATILDQIDVKLSTAIMSSQNNKRDFVGKVPEDKNTQGHHFTTD